MILDSMLTLAGGLMAALDAGGTGDICTALDVRAVQVGGEIGRRLQATVDNNLLAIDLDRDFLAPFQKHESAGGYIGLGKTLDAFARFAAYTGDTRLVQRKQHLVNVLLQSQGQDGYIGIMRPESRVGTLWDVHEMSYLVLGLTSDYRFCGEKASLEAARKLADYLIRSLSAEPTPKTGPDDLSAVMPTTGLDEAFLSLSEQTGDPQYRDFVAGALKLAAWQMPLVLGRWGKIEGHAYAYMCECLAQIRLDRYTPDARLWEPTRGVFQFLLDGDGLVISGTCGDHECWHNTQSGTTNLGETCTTTYLLRLCDELMRRTGKPLYGDLMERGIHNALFGAQSPDGRQIRYYTPFEAPRVYHHGDTYCCPCNFRRIVAELPGMAFYRRGDGVFVNLFVPAKAEFRLEGDIALTLQQESDYPNSGDTKIGVSLSHPAEFTLYVRIPRWSKSVEVRINGQAEPPNVPEAGLLAVRREWKTGDALEVRFPMDFRVVKGRRTQQGRVAIVRGPMVFTFNPKRNPELADKDPRLLTLDPGSIQGPFPDDSVRPGGMSCRAKVWMPGAWYPAEPAREIVLSEFADPDATATYFHIPNPGDERLVDDELTGAGHGPFELKSP